MALIAHWPLDGRLDDISGNGHHINPEYSLIFENTGRLGKSINVKRNAGRMFFNSPMLQELLNSNNYSISFWCNQLTLDSPWGYIIIVDDISNANYRIEHGRDNYQGNVATNAKIQWMNPHTNGNSHLITAISMLVGKNEWFLVTLVRDGAKYKLYSNNTLCAEVTRNDMNSVIANSLKFGHSHVNDLINDIRLYSHSLSIPELTKLAKAPLIDLDFKGSIPPTVNWLDSNDKSLQYLANDSGGSILQKNENSFFIQKRNSVQNSLHFKIPYKEFTISFKIKILDGLIKNVGGHGSWNGTSAIPDCKVVVNDYKMSYNWSSPINLNRIYTTGETLNCEVTVSLPSIPTWETELGFFIQPNRQITETEYVNLDYEIYDIQIEEGLVRTPFCTWSRDYLEIPDKSPYRESFVCRALTTLPTLKLGKVLDIGSSTALEFVDQDKIDLGISHPNIFTTLMVIRKDIEGDSYIYHSYLNPDSPNRFRVFIMANGKINVQTGTSYHETTSTNERIELNKTYLIVIRFDSTSRRLVVTINGTTHIDKVIAESFIMNPLANIQIGRMWINNQPSNFTMSDFKIIPVFLTDQEIADEYTKLKNRVSTFAHAFSNIPTLNSEVPKLWERNPNTIGIECFSGNINIPETQAIPIGWGGAFKQPDNSTFSTGYNLDVFIKPPEEVLYVDTLLNDNIPHGLIIETDNTNTTETNLTLIKKSRF